MNKDASVDPESAERVAELLQQTSNTVFDTAPVMMHSLDRSGAVLRVNRRWSEALGYEASEAVGRKGPDFLTPESRVRAINETLPLFWRTGHARSIGYRFLRKSGDVIDLLLDAELGLAPDGTLCTYAALYPFDDPVERELASKTLKELRTLTKLQRTYESALLSRQAGRPRQESEEGPQFAPSEVVPAFGELTRDTSINLRALAKAHEELARGAAGHEQELVLVLKSIDKTLAYLADAVASAPWMSG